MLRCIAIVAGFCVGYVFFEYVSNTISLHDARSNIAVLSTIMATLLGFMVSAAALLYAVANTALTRNLQRTGHFNKLLGEMFFCGAFLFCGVITCLIVIFWPESSITEIRSSSFGYFLTATLTVAAIGIFLLVPVGEKMWEILSNIKPDNPNQLE